MLFVSSTLLLLVNAVTLRRERSILFNRVAILILLFFVIVWYNSLNIVLLDTLEDIYGGLFHLTFITHSFALFLCIIGAIVLLTVYYPRRSQKSMGAMGRKMSSFLLTQYTDNYFGIYQNNIIKMWDKIIFLEFAFIILLIEQIFLMSSSDLVSILSTTAGDIGFSDFFLLTAIIPIKIYSNAEAEKDTILKDNKNKSGIYMWKNSINGKRYIGSSENLKRRFLQYFNVNHLQRYNSMYICRALLKHDYFNFSLEILEYCEPEKCIEREDFYLSSEKPEYNILPKAGSPLGHKHSDETKIIMSDAKKGEKNPMFGKTGENNPMYGKNHTEETKTIMSDTKKGKNHPNYGKPRYEGAGSSSQAIEVTDVTNDTTTSYDSISAAAKALNISQ